MKKISSLYLISIITFAYILWSGDDDHINSQILSKWADFQTHSIGEGAQGLTMLYAVESALNKVTYLPYFWGKREIPLNQLSWVEMFLWN